GPVWGYLYGWTAGVVINPASIAAIAVGFATYLGFFVPLADSGIKGVAIVSIVALTVLNALGVKLGVLIQNVLTLVKIGLLAVLIAVGFVVPGGNLENFSPVWPEAPLGSLIAPFGVAMLAAPWLLVQCIIAIALTWISTEPSWKDTYNRLFTYVVVSGFVFYAMSCGAVIRLRYTAAGLSRPYKAWGYPVTPILFILFSLWLVINTAREQPRDFAEGAVLILAGLPVYWLRRRASCVVRHPSTAGPLRTTDDG